VATDGGDCAGEPFRFAGRIVPGRAARGIRWPVAGGDCPASAEVPGFDCLPGVVSDRVWPGRLAVGRGGPWWGARLAGRVMMAGGPWRPVGGACEWRAVPPFWLPVGMFNGCHGPVIGRGCAASVEVPGFDCWPDWPPGMFSTPKIHTQRIMNPMFSRT